MVTFLILCNLGLWITYNFEIQKVASRHPQPQVAATPDQVEFYGFFPWIVIQRITLPLCVFFRSISTLATLATFIILPFPRFHSTVVLAELWKNCYMLRKTDTQKQL